MNSCIITRSVFARLNVISLVRQHRPFVCYFSSRARPKPETFLYRPDKVEIVDEVEDGLTEKTIKYRRHPGVVNISAQRVPPDIHKSIGRTLIKGEHISIYKAQGKEMEKYFQNRKLPVETYDVSKLRSDIERRLREKEAKKGNTPENFTTAEELAAFEEEIQKKTDQRVGMATYRWKAMEYNSQSKCATYCVIRFAPEFCALRRVFNEIVKRAPDYKPKHLLDFGSGVGTTFFATENTWTNSVQEYFCVDSSHDMIDFFHKLLCDGDPEKKARHPNVTFRAFLPGTAERQFDLVVSAYSLFELPSYEERMRVVANLWCKTTDFLVLIERGTNAGFRAVVEARDYVLNGAHEVYRTGMMELADKMNLDLTEMEQILKRKNITEAEKFRLLREKYPGVDIPTLLPHGHVFAPCPHDMGCPRLMDVTPCNFSTRYFPLRLSGGDEKLEQEVFSFVILRKGPAPPSTNRWPRIVREPRKSSACIWCQTCTPHGVLEDKPFHKGPAKTERGKQFRLVKRSSWGDLLPMVTSYGTSTEPEAKAKTAADADVEEWLDRELDESSDGDGFEEEESSSKSAVTGLKDNMAKDKTSDA